MSGGPVPVVAKPASSRQIQSRLRDMQVLSQELISDEYLRRLRADLNRGTLVRFLVAYVSDAGLRAIGSSLLLARLRHSESFGVASISCSCGYKPLLNLQARLQEQRLKYFMDPSIKGKGEPYLISVLHSKVVYIADIENQKSIVYVGSHNWTSRALAAGDQRNGEISLRYEEPFSQEHLEGSSVSVAGQVNRHLQEACELALSIPATIANEPRFAEWTRNACTQEKGQRLDEVIVLLAVLDHTSPALSVSDWERLTDSNIYVQILEEHDGGLLWNAARSVHVWVWESLSAFRESRSHFILRCRITSKNAGEASELRGTNASPSPIEGFRSVVARPPKSRQIVDEESSGAYVTRSGREARLYTFTHPCSSDKSEDFDKSVEPLYQFCLEVESVVVPLRCTYDCATPPNLVWSPDSLAVASRPSDAPVQRSPGFRVSKEEELHMHECLVRFGVHKESRGVLPYSDFDENLVGKRVSAHPLHETYLNLDDPDTLPAIYAHAEKGALVPKAMLLRDSQTLLFEDVRLLEPLAGVQKVYMSAAKHLERLWKRHREN